MSMFGEGLTVEERKEKLRDLLKSLGLSVANINENITEVEGKELMFMLPLFIGFTVFISDRVNNHEDMPACLRAAANVYDILEIDCSEEKDCNKIWERIMTLRRRGN